MPYRDGRHAVLNSFFERMPRFAPQGFTSLISLMSLMGARRRARPTMNSNLEILNEC